MTQVITTIVYSSPTGGAQPGEVLVIEGDRAGLDQLAGVEDVQAGVVKAQAGQFCSPFLAALQAPVFLAYSRLNSYIKLPAVS
jgi:hypothetical protein